jgi:sortase (surface protein transpeptidase)
MRKPIFIAGYLVAMAIVGFLVIPRLVLHRPAHQLVPVAVNVTPAATPAPTATPTATPLPASPYPAARLIVPSLHINSAWTPIGFEADGKTMDSPAGPMDLGWYNFTDEPGGDSNAVFSGHVDWYTGAATIFQGLRSPGLKEGDEIDVSRADGKLRTYHVVSLSNPDENADATPYISPTDVPTVTLITCVGDWNPQTHEYSNRLIVVAQAT